MGSILDRLDAEPAESWKPVVGDQLVGVVENMARFDGGGYEPYTIVTIVEPSGVRKAVHAFHTTLANSLDRDGVCIGDEIGIRYEGKKPSKGVGKDYHAYKVVVQHPAGWSPSTAPAPAPASTGFQGGGTQSQREPVRDEDIPF